MNHCYEYHRLSRRTRLWNWAITALCAAFVGIVAAGWLL